MSTVFGIGMFGYAQQNPLRLLDPDGNETAAERAHAWKVAKEYVAAHKRLTARREKHPALRNVLPRNYYKLDYKHPAKGAPGHFTDCSGLTKNAYPKLPNGTTAQIAATRSVDINYGMKGDTIFFNMGSAHHTGILGDPIISKGGTLKGYDFIQIGKTSGASHQSIIFPGATFPHGNYWYRHFNSIRVRDPSTDPGRWYNGPLPGTPRGFDLTPFASVPAVRDNE